MSFYFFKNTFTLLFSVVFILIGLSSSGIAQSNIQQIKLSGSYYFGDGYSSDRQESIDLARRDLTEKIVVSVASDSRLEIEEDDVSITSIAQMRIRSMSRLQLRGLNYITEKRRDQSYHTVAYIRKAQFYESLDIEKQTLFTKLDFALQSERTGNYQQAISTYIELLARSVFFPQAVLTQVERHGVHMEMQHFARNRINTFLNELDIRFVRADDRGTQQSPELYLIFQVTHRGTPVNGLWMGIVGDGFAEHIVFNGNVEVYYDQMIDRNRINIPFRISPRPGNDLDEDLVPIAMRSTPSLTRPIEVSMMDVIKPDIRVEELSGGRYRFHPMFSSAFSVSEVRWEFSDGTVSTEVSPVHRFSDTTSPVVTMTLNRMNDLRVRKVIGSTITETRITSPEVSTPAPRPTQTGYRAPASHQTHLNQMLRFHSADELLAYLHRLRDSRQVRFGRSSDVRPELSYIAIVENSTNRVHTILSPVDQRLRFNLKTNASYAENEVQPRYSGYRVVWFQFN